MSVADLYPFANHLWQSTLCVGVVWLLIHLLRRNHAHVRYLVWLAASGKFLVPFAAFVAIGRQFGWQRSTSIVQPEMTLVIDAISQPFSRPEVAAVNLPAGSAITTALPVLLLVIWSCGCAMHLLAWRVRWRRVAVVVRQASPLLNGRELDILRRLEKLVGVRHQLAVVTSDTSLEPGVFGILKPVLVWPGSIGERLSDCQLEAVLAHELCHVGRRDNLAVAVHMVVEVLFWFHPLVWWLEKRLVDERERACDEEVLRLGSEPQLYAESILKTCEFCVEWPSIVAGVTGSDLKKRVEAIMRGHTGQELKAWKKLLLATVGVLTVAAPVTIGVLKAPLLRAETQAASVSGPTFEVASIKPNKSAEAGTMLGIQRPSGHFSARNIRLRELIRMAYQLQDFQISGAPGWIGSARFDIEGKPEGDPQTGADGVAPQWLMVRTLLADRFHLRVHKESRTLPIYALILARTDRKLGPQLRSTEGGCKAVVEERERGGPPSPPDAPFRCGLQRRAGAITGRDRAMTQLASLLGPLVGRIVIDRTGLMKNFDFDLSWMPEQIAPSPTGLPEPAQTDSSSPSIFTALQEQLGLKLESTKGPVEVLVIDSVEQPTPD